MSFFDPEQEDKLKEECGVFGIYNPDGSAAAPSIYYGLSALARPCKYNIYKNIEGKADIPPFQCINSDVQK